MNDPLDQLDRFPMVKHAVGKIGWVLARKDDGPRPAFRVLTTHGQQIWWHQDRCTFINPTHYGLVGAAPPETK
jgi:hypothetical protein